MNNKKREDHSVGTNYTTSICEGEKLWSQMCYCWLNLHVFAMRLSECLILLTFCLTGFGKYIDK